MARPNKLALSQNKLQREAEEGERLLENFPEAFFAHQPRKKAMEESINRLIALASNPDLLKMDPAMVAVTLNVEKAIQRGLSVLTHTELRAASIVAKIGFSRKAGAVKQEA